MALAFRHLPVLSLTDATLNFEQLVTGVKYGRVELAFPGATIYSNPLTVPHGLGVVPSLVLGMALSGSAAPSAPLTVEASVGPDATNLYLILVSSGVVAGGSKFLAWWLAAV